MDIKRLSSRNLGRDDRYVMNLETDLYGTNIHVHVGSYMYFFLPNKTQKPPGAFRIILSTTYLGYKKSQKGLIYPLKDLK